VLTPLMSRVIGGWLLFMATGALATLVETRHAAYRLFFPAVSLWFAVLFVSSLLNWDDFRDDRLATPSFLVATALTALGMAGISAWLEARLRRQVRARPASVAAPG
jgi:hypothetical protein